MSNGLKTGRTRQRRCLVCATWRSVWERYRAARIISMYDYYTDFLHTEHTQKIENETYTVYAGGNHYWITVLFAVCAGLNFYVID